MPSKLNTIDADTLQSTVYEPIHFLISDLLPQGLHRLHHAGWHEVLRQQAT